MTTQEELFEEKSTRSATTKALAEEKGARLATEQALKNSDEAKAKLSYARRNTQAAYTVTRDNLASKSKEQHDVVICHVSKMRRRNSRLLRVRRTHGCCWNQLGRTCPSVKTPPSR
jgi:hypothetical protein